MLNIFFHYNFPYQDRFRCNLQEAMRTNNELLDLRTLLEGLSTCQNFVLDTAELFYWSN